MYIEIDGMDGTFKSTVAEKVVERLEKSGFKVKLVRQPGGTVISEKLRSFTKYGYQGCQPSVLTSFFMFMGARSQLHHEVIGGLLDDDYIVVSDRGNLSTIAYQGFGFGIDLGLIEQSIGELGDRAVPDLILRIDVDYEISKSRTENRGTTDNIESLGEDFHQRVLKGYREYENVDKICNNYRVINGFTDSVELSSDDLTDLAVAEIVSLAVKK